MSAFTLLARPFRWFRKAPKTEYEEVLADLTAEIDHVQSNLVQVQARKRRATLILPFWASILWLVWTVVMYFLGELQMSTFSSSNAWIIWGPVLLVPFLIFFTRRIVRWWYKRVQAAEEEHLKDLQRQRRAKIEEIKRATKYDHLRLLLEKYDDEKKPVTSQQGRVAAGPQTPMKGGKPQQQGQAPGSAVARPPVPGQQPLPSAMRGSQGTGAPTPAGFGQPQAQSRAPAAPAQRTWLDRMADSVLGADPSSTALGPEQKYALICVSCKRHNGLARKEEFEEVQYICPHCGVFNTRRPSSMPVSSPWRASQAQETSSGEKSRSDVTAGKSGTEAARGFSSSLLRNDAARDGTDSPPPATPLARHSDDEEDEVEEHEIRDASVGAKGGVTKRRSGRLAGMELD
ncbi:hypothetical protein BCV69DRAFT_297736 [Microstroma glucosiphilum]|uniref:Endoplasmic reticulum junction formation protein lunapark n=1 Tax=Pseudomicrostroma glucosiphilum TaxID=1684307 RepID=A0A316UGZ2_9BASI|nr:hypothetical protein BCV69DRAFT_297736 [Pseudomicrostroma glucosiphilum]PWN22445.1 hypothetical protein BCV69DRAFT_297736 [Pseudomicrostroma glucosiphilum]